MPEHSQYNPQGRAQFQIIDIGSVSYWLSFARTINDLLLLGVLLLISQSLLALLSGSSGVETLGNLGILLLMSPLVWRLAVNVDMLSAVANGRAIWSLSIITTVFLGWGMVLRNPVMLAIGAPTGAILIIVWKVQCQPTGLGTNFKQFLRGVAMRARDLPLPRVPISLVNRVKGLFLLALGSLFTLCFLPLQVSGTTRNAIQIQLMMLPLGYFMLLCSRHYMRPNFNAVTGADKRPPIVFLRPFRDDKFLLFPKIRLDELLDFSLEARLAKYFYSFGPFIALGRPLERPYSGMTLNVGAVKTRLSDEEWKDRITEWVTNASVVLLWIGDTKGIEWELGRVIELGCVQKLIIAFSDDSSPAWRRDDDCGKRLSTILAAFTGTPWESGLSEIRRAKDLRSIAFLAKGRGLIVNSVPRNRTSYYVATLLAHQAQIDDGRVSLPSSGVVPRRRHFRWLSALVGSLFALGVLVFGINTQGYRLLWSLDPEIPMARKGSLSVRGLMYWDPITSDPTRSRRWRQGETLNLMYFVVGAKRDSSDNLNVVTEVALVDGRGNRDFMLRDRITSIGGLGAAEGGFLFKISPDLPVGDYKFDIRIYDLISGSEIEFMPPLVVEPSQL